MIAKPRIRILPDLEGMYYCGLFDGGYSSLYRVFDVSLERAIWFYLKVLRADDETFAPQNVLGDNQDV